MVGGLGVKVSLEETVKVFLSLRHRGLVDGSPVVKILEKSCVGAAPLLPLFLDLDERWQPSLLSLRALPKNQAGGLNEKLPM